ncbi:MAG TPA: TonB-dependent receptor plug domain-containing protein, partial [Chitinophaga sp.]
MKSSALWPDKESRFAARRVLLFTKLTLVLAIAALSRVSAASVAATRLNEKNMPSVPAAFPVKGKVTDEKGTPIPGVTVRLKDSQINAVTNSNGEFTINVPDGNGVLLFSSVGFDPKEINISHQSNISVQLAEKRSDLNEVVVVSYGTSKRRDITGALNVVSAAAVKDVPAAEFGQKLQGKVPGVQITEASGMPGQANQFRIRGAASLSSGYQPLIVVDGQPLTGEDSRNGGAGLLNPDEIETITVLKDASASALYGSRAANGVLL